ncbi:MAG: hypothetical protein NZZ41_01850 [Candidatus Dojkabacteria bacterium]|nr:hypothetical protein [Candidatus Dojkabacteria bacterium]
MLSKDKINTIVLNIKKMVYTDKKIIYSITIFLPIFVLLLIRSISDQKITLSLVVFLAFLFLIGILYVYISIDDIQTFSINTKLAYILLILSFLCNILIALFNGIGNELVIFHGNNFSPSYNIVAGGIVAGITYLLVKISKGKWLGEGDIFVYTSAALLLGSNKILLSVYLCLTSSCVYGIFLGLKRRRYRNIVIPFIPFIVFSTFCTLLFYNEITTFTKQLLPYLFI